MKIGHRGSGFTLVELMVVAVIVAILAAVAVPLMAVNRKRAMVTEAEAGLGTVRGAMRAMFAETRDYSHSYTGSAIVPGSAMVIPGVGPVDLEGQYFTSDDYTIRSVSPTSFVLQCSGSSGDVAGVVLTLDQDGQFVMTGM